MFSLKNFPYYALCLTLWIATATSLEAAGDVVYEWTDSNGITQYTQHPPATGDYKQIKLRGGAGAAPSRPGAQESLQQLQKQKGEQQEQATLAQKKAEDEKTRREHCQRTKEYLELLQTKPRISMKEGDKYTVMTEEQKQATIKELQTKYEENCQ